jgi:hypothetical protein
MLIPPIKKYHPWSCIILGLSLFLASSCIDRDFRNLSDPVVLDQDISVPLGPVTFRLDTPSVSDSSSQPGRYGLYYYNGLPYPNNSVYFRLTNVFNFDLNDKNGKSDFIRSLSMVVTVKNFFPADAYVQVYLIDGGRADFLFESGETLLKHGITNASGDVVASTDTVLTIPFEGNKLALLKQTKSLYYSCKVSTMINGQPAIRFSDKDYLQISIGMRMKLEINAQESN